MNLQPLYDVKERLEYAAIAGVSLLGEDFRLKRAAEGLKRLAAASPVFARLDGGLTRLLSAPAEARAGLLLDVLALVDAVAYTQAKTGIEGELEPLSAGNGSCQQIFYGQIAPLLTALTTTGSGRLEVIQSAWETHPEWFADFRVLPVVVADLGDSYGEIAEWNTKILKQVGPAAVPVLKQGFDPAGKKEMARRVEVISAIEGAKATPWLREVLPEAKKDVRIAVLNALGGDTDNTTLLLELSQTERGKNRDAVLNALSLMSGEEVIAFWEEELEKHKDSVTFLRTTQADWASDLVARGLWDRFEAIVEQTERVDKEAHMDCLVWLGAAHGKSSPSMLDFWRWADGSMAAIDRLKNHTGLSLRLGEELTNHLLASVCCAGRGSLCGLCLELWEKHKKEPRYLNHAVIAALYTHSAAKVYDEFSPYVPTVKPLIGAAYKRAMSKAVITGLLRVNRREDGIWAINGGQPIAGAVDSRWIKRIIHSAWKDEMDKKDHPLYGTVKAPGVADEFIMRLANPSDPEVRQELIPYLRGQMVKTGFYQKYSRWLFDLGSSPKGVLGEAMKKGKPAHLLDVWQLLNAASKALPAEETAALCQEVLDAKWIRSVGVEGTLAELVIPRTIQQLQEGRPFPSWDEWWQDGRDVAIGMLS